ncbi:phosphatidylglycerophosphatase A [Idiomarina seosinensis]|uniref:phosphatidylglycerophosphatase A family protein n=1 Tax=Idiomarina seosinensis TaxID=281739 RepID=UPI00384F47EE
MKRWPSVRMTNPLHFLALGFGSGLAPKAPGTFGTLAAIPLVGLLSLTSVWFYLIFLVAGVIFGIYLCGVTAKAMGEHDHPAIVWDEIVGYAIAMFALPFEWPYIIASFLLFRLFDIAKPGPIGWADRQLTGGMSVMLDDVMAGIVSAAIIHLGLILI